MSLVSDQGMDSPVHSRQPADDSGADAASIIGDPAWRSISSDPVLSRPPTPGSPGNVPPGDDLRLDIGWDRFEQLLAFVAQGVLGLNQIRFRRYGVSGQAQHGIDLAGRSPDGAYIVVQCKEYDTFTPADLRAAVERFATGKRPFAAQHLIVAASTVARTTQLEDELAVLQDEYKDLHIEMWGAEQINDALRERADIVSRFWTRETAETFCTGAPLPGVAAAAPNWVRVADQILLSPLGVDGLDDQLADAERLRTTDPAAAADVYWQLAGTLAVDGFAGHASVLRHKQLDALAEAGKLDDVAALTAQLAATALHEADINQAQMMGRRLDELVRNPVFADVHQAQMMGRRVDALLRDPSTKVTGNADESIRENTAKVSTTTARHAELISAAVSAATHPLGDSSALTTVLRNPPPGLPAPAYQPLLVLLLAELTAADTIVAPSNQAVVTEADGKTSQGAAAMTARLAELDDLITSGLTQLADTPSASADKEATLRLRLLRACYDADERTKLLTLARQQRLPRKHAALVLAAQARRDALDGSVDEALEHWRQAVRHAIDEGRTDDAGGWLYAIPAVNARYGPWTNRIGEEHLLAQALPKTTSGRLIRRVSDPETDARSAVLDGRPVEAIRAARRWLADSIVIGDWVDEETAAELLGDLYASNAEPERAAACYQWAGETKKLTELAAVVGDRLLPPSPVGSGPWWQQATSLASIAEQHDLLDDDSADRLLSTLLDLVVRGRAGELTDSPTQSLTLQAAKTACMLAGRGTSDDAQALLDQFAGDVARTENQYQHHDKQHVQACQAIALHHKELVWPALMRIFDLAEVGTHDALGALRGPLVLELLREPSPGLDDPPTGTSGQPRLPSLTGQQRLLLRERLQGMAAAGRYDAGVAISALGGVDQGVTDRAVQARDRLLNRPEPDGHTVSFGTQMVSDSYLVTFLDLADQRACLDKMLTVAADRREAAPNRQEALIAAGNLVGNQSDQVRAEVHARSRAFVDGDQDGSFLDAETTNPHPLSSMKVDFGSASLRAAGLHLAQCTAITGNDRMWVRDRATVMLGSKDEHLVHQGAVTLSRLGVDVISDLDASMLAGYPLPVVRQLATIVAAATPVRYAQALKALAADPDITVRILLARRLRQAKVQAADTSADVGQPGGDGRDRKAAVRAIITEVLGVLAEDRRHTVRRAAAGLDS
jgi:hypothetical protein